MDDDGNFDIGDPSALLRDDDASEKSLKQFLQENDIIEKYDHEGNTNGVHSDRDEVSSAKQTKNSLVHKKIALKIHNIIASANLSVDIDLRLVAISIRNAEYNPSKINTLIVRLNKPKCTVLIFKSGRLMLTGTKTKADAIYGCKKIGKIIKLVTNEPVKLEGFNIENIIASADCNMPIRLEMLAHDHKDYCNYEPELFAGLVYRYKPTSKLKSVILIFVSGKIIITGCKSVQKLYTVFDDIYNVLLQYRS
ncbi:TATA-box binding protein, putative [Plasmodium knowlesi strain H]|uniref:TATA-box binding protein, putative n=3 Tax=Plasmodium knowlesi TaxID=5850 RepID=A0A5K1U310_PLAKH|nr:TATA-box-binding protein, putative [Plasmodium knowlesi strain H]OTN66931.1 putative TATA-box binding protein [Plasmodium knowlesi]CAA9988778.1 TATA-box-binding protein, putative [Plasmodium knowlesi strain H]SBO21727.1 TATA-box binding protein, putative [Plasmodium knowlesi strain H]SBO22123.1 TATA-box binding protein, putative [Plasmodium knowlesi strain H]VVS78252.1 TATA-box-binding protein, putative [Plasmodium knowlesi strain H]|eukprot:XP_002259755.1 transcription initiation factor TFiid,TATA-binding protein, putative [Plasmodium knowlesi strain H]